METLERYLAVITRHTCLPAVYLKPMYYKVLLKHAGLTSVHCHMKEVVRQGVLIILWHRNYLAKNSRDIRLFASSQSALFCNHIVAPPHKFVEHGRQERTEVLQSLFESHKNESVTRSIQVTLLQLFPHALDGKLPSSPGKTNTAHDGA